MNLIEVVAVFAIVGLGVSCGAVASDGGAVCGVLGALAGLGFFPLLGLAAVHIEPTFTGRPHWPRCSDCGGGDYRFDWSLGHCLARCACGAGHVRRGRQFLRVLADGATRPYLRWRPLRGWVDDSTPTADEARAPYRDHDPAR